MPLSYHLDDMERENETGGEANDVDEGLASTRKSLGSVLMYSQWGAHGIDISNNKSTITTRKSTSNKGSAPRSLVIWTRMQMRRMAMLSVRSGLGKTGISKFKLSPHACKPDADGSNRYLASWLLRVYIFILMANVLIHCIQSKYGAWNRDWLTA